MRPCAIESLGHGLPATTSHDLSPCIAPMHVFPCAVNKQGFAMVTTCSHNLSPYIATRMLRKQI